MASNASTAYLMPSDQFICGIASNTQSLGHLLYRQHVRIAIKQSASPSLKTDLPSHPEAFAKYQ